MDIKTIGAGGSGWTTVRHDTNLPGEEYYRREVRFFFLFICFFD